MSEKLIVDLRRELRDFVEDLGPGVQVPAYVLTEVVNMVFDILIFELEEIDSHEEPDLAVLGDFYHTVLQRDSEFTQRFLESFFFLVKDIAGQLRAHGVLCGSGFKYYPEKNLNNRSIVVSKFNDN